MSKTNIIPNDIIPNENRYFPDSKMHHMEYEAILAAFALAQPLPDEWTSVSFIDLLTEAQLITPMVMAPEIDSLIQMGYLALDGNDFIIATDMTFEFYAEELSKIQK